MADRFIPVLLSGSQGVRRMWRPSSGCGASGNGPKNLLGGYGTAKPVDGRRTIRFGRPPSPLFEEPDDADAHLSAAVLAFDEFLYVAVSCNAGLLDERCDVRLHGYELARPHTDDRH
jgi:hypothetical protein